MNSRTKNNWSSLLLGTLLFSTSVGAVPAQDVDSEKSVISNQPKEAVQDVVRRILIYKFKPLSKKKIVFLAKQIYFSGPGSSKFGVTIEQSWVPEVKNVEFLMLTAPFDKEVYFFKEWDFKTNVYQIAFAFGDPTCSFAGNLWKFRVSGGRTRLWPDGVAGGGCSNHYAAPD